MAASTTGAASAVSASTAGAALTTGGSFAFGLRVLFLGAAAVAEAVGTRIVSSVQEIKQSHTYLGNQPARGRSLRLEKQQSVKQSVQVSLHQP